MRNFKTLRIWQLGVDIALKCYKLTNSFPTAEKYTLRSQITKAAVSIPSNIAEGCGKSSEKDLTKYLEIALGSAFELETQLIISHKLSFGEKQIIEELLSDISLEQQMLVMFIKKL